MIKIVILCGIAFMIGNITWTEFNEPKVFYIPLAALLVSLFWELKIKYKEASNVLKISIDYLFMLSWGNLVKQIFYSPDMKFINDYVWGGLVTAWFIGLLLYSGYEHKKKISRVNETKKIWKR